MTKQPITPFMPFADETASIQVGGLTLENRFDRISVYGSIDITCDKEGLAVAQQLKGRLDQIVESLKTKSLPDRIELQLPTLVPNPFFKGTES